MKTAREARNLHNRLMNDQSEIDKILHTIDILADSFLEEVVSPKVEWACKNNLFSIPLSRFYVEEFLERQRNDL